MQVTNDLNPYVRAMKLPRTKSVGDLGTVDGEHADSADQA